MENLLIKLPFFLFYIFLIWKVFRLNINEMTFTMKIGFIVIGFIVLIIERMALKSILVDKKMINGIWAMGFMILILFIVLIIFHYMFVGAGKNINIELALKANSIFNTLKVIACFIILILIIFVFFF